MNMLAPPHDDLIRPPAPMNMTAHPHDDLIRPELAPPPMKGHVSLVDKLQCACTALTDEGEKSVLPADWDRNVLSLVVVIGVQVCASTPPSWLDLVTLLMQKAFPNSSCKIYSN